MIFHNKGRKGRKEEIRVWIFAAFAIFAVKYLAYLLLLAWGSCYSLRELDVPFCPPTQNWIDFIYDRGMVQVLSLCVTHSRF